MKKQEKKDERKIRAYEVIACCIAKDGYISRDEYDYFVMVNKIVFLHLMKTWARLIKKSL